MGAKTASPEPLRIGVLGAARIAARAIAGPADTTGDRLVAVAARDRRRAEAFAAVHGGERVLDSYADVVADPDVGLQPARQRPPRPLEPAWAGGPPRLLAARGGEQAGHPGVDEWLEADLGFPGGATGTARCHMAGEGVRMTCRIVGDQGEATAANFALPTMDDRVTVTAPAGRSVERLGTRPTYTYQLEALRAHLRDGAPLPIDADDALATMELIDACYRAAGFQPRPRTPPT